MSVLLAFALASTTATGTSTPLISPDKGPIEPWKMLGMEVLLTDNKITSVSTMEVVRRPKFEG